MFRLSWCSSQSCSIFNGLEPDVISSVCLMIADTGTNGNVTCYCVCSAGDSVQGGSLQVFMAALERNYMKRHRAVKLQQKMANKSHRLVIKLAFWQVSHISVRFKKWSDWTTTLNCTGCSRYFRYNPHAARLEMFTRVCTIELCNNNRFAWQIQINVSISDDGLVILR